MGQQWLGVKGGAPEATSASRPPRRRRRTWVIASLATVWVAFVVLIAALVLWPRLAPALQYETLVAGDEVTLRSGLSLVVPDGAEGGFSHWRRMMDEAGGALEPADDVLISFGSTPSELSVGLSALWAGEAGAETPIDLISRQQLVAASADGSVEISGLAHGRTRTSG